MYKYSYLRERKREEKIRQGCKGSVKPRKYDGWSKRERERASSVNNGEGEETKKDRRGRKTYKSE